MNSLFILILCYTLLAACFISLFSWAASVWKHYKRVEKRKATKPNAYSTSKVKEFSH